ncbi:unnamed protein product [Tuber melanosporum]|uniref:(Perigord truffle) hypothetical protein n=1 Tax=Tuber melanosporum (strain Mel28) TaxID=656061 RepID=D5GBW1_TUBMM|nr:uncharacterized protein GSTUM_00005613001 [Tuber melanosporum]CAZ81961.1 unnamed protein product [Tuber melanosporum]
MPIIVDPLRQFFEQFDFERYTYDPDAPAHEEFDRLCEARQWGSSKIRRYRAEFLLALPEEQDPLSQFFEQFDFERYTYDPDIPAHEEFERLCEARQWGPSKIRRYKAEFLLALSQEQDPLSQFFEQFDFERYTYDPDIPPRKEFDRLCEARQWGSSKISHHETEFFLALSRELDRSGSSVGIEVIKFFRRYEYSLFTYDIDEPVQSEFQRLVGLRGWGNARLSKVTREFNDAVALDARGQSGYSTSEPTTSENPGTLEEDLLADWLRARECPGYEYSGDLHELEFKKLADAKRREWLRCLSLERGRPTSIEERRGWKISPEFLKLRNGFYAVVEKVFNLQLGNFCRVTGLTPWQVFVELYGNGQQNVGKRDAKTILHRVFINIFDFLDAFGETLKNPRTTNGKKALRKLKPLARELQFPSNLMLGVYSALTNRVFPIDVVDRQGTLVLLLQPIKVYLRSFDDVMREFEEEAVDELQEAEEEGRVGIRRLLLSREWDSLDSL